MLSIEKAMHNKIQPRKCLWVIDATELKFCSKLLKRGNLKNYCPKHQRGWKQLKNGSS